MVKISIDETGNLGEGGGDYFVIAASVMKTPEAQKKAARLIRKTQKKRFGVFRKEIKFSEMSFEERVDILNQIALIDNVYIYYIAIYKPNAAILRKLPHNLAYNYFSGMLIDRIVSDFNEDIKFADVIAGAVGSFYRHSGDTSLISIIEPKIIKCHCEEYPEANFINPFLKK